MNNPNAPNVLVKFSTDETFVAISTYCRGHGRRGRFLIACDRLRALLGGTVGTLYDSDCGHHLTATLRNGLLFLTLDWLSEYSDGTLRGFRQRVELPVEAVADSLATGQPFTHLYRPTESRARIDASHAGQALHDACADPITRRSLSKALRDNFRWRADTVTLYRDGAMDFFFRTASGCPACGGLVLHHTTVSTPVGMRPKYYYGVHT